MTIMYFNVVKHEAEIIAWMISNTVSFTSPNKDFLIMECKIWKEEISLYFLSFNRKDFLNALVKNVHLI